MADYGLKIKNEAGGVQIDSEYRNYTLYDSGSDNTVADGTGSFLFSNTSETPIIAIKASLSTPVALSGVIKSSGEYVGCYMNSNAIVSVPWAVYTPARTVPSSDYGLLIRNSANEIVFSSDENPLKIDGLYNSSLAYSSSYIDITVEDATNNYFYLSNWSWRLLAPSPQPYILSLTTRGIKRINSTTIRVINFETSLGAIPVSVAYTSWENSFSLIEIRV